MEDTNVMKIKKYIPGYNSDYKQVIEPSFLDSQNMLDYDTDIFKYGLSKTRPTHFFQDPLFPTFDLIILSNSPLLGSGPNTLRDFLNNYSEIYSIEQRKKLHNEFIKTLYMLFNAEFKTYDDAFQNNKAYYINSISGLDKIIARIVDYEKDKITLNLNEDVSMIAGYLTQLYNNLSYSYRDQKQMIPANLLRFNMAIKIHDVRNMPLYKKDENGDSITTFEKSYMIYLLRDCIFDFKKTKNFDDSIIVGGYDAGTPNKPSSISFDIYYKSINVESEFPFISDSFERGSSALIINNQQKDFSGLTYNSMFINNEKDPEYLDFTNKNAIDTNNSIDSSIKTGSTEDLLKFKDQTSSLIKGNSKRDDILGNKNIKNDKDIYKIELFDNRRNSNIKNEKIDIILRNEYQISESEKYKYTPSINDSEWEFLSDFPGKPQTIFAQESLRNSLLSQINFGVFLRDLPLDIIQLFMDGYHGLRNEEYISGTGPDVSYGPRGVRDSANFPSYRDSSYLDGDIIDDLIMTPGGTKPNPNPPDNEPIPQVINFNNLQGEQISFNIPNAQFLNGEFIPFAIPLPIGLNNLYINNFASTRTYLNGEFIPFAIPSPIGLNNESINTLATLPEYLNGQFIPFSLRPPIELKDQFIDIQFLPKQYLDNERSYVNLENLPKNLNNETINFIIKPKLPLTGEIDTSFRLKEPFFGFIPYNIKTKQVLNEFINTDIKPKLLLNANIDTTFKERNKVDLGLIGLNIDNENILPIIYLYESVKKFNYLNNYYIYNNVNNAGEKEFNKINIDSTFNQKEQFAQIFKYDNNTNISKILSDLQLYFNNQEKNNNLEFINVINDITKKMKIEEISLYQNQNFNHKKIENLNLNNLIPTNTNVLNNIVINKEERQISKLNNESIFIEVDKNKFILNNQDKIDIFINKKFNNQIDSIYLYEKSIYKPLLNPILLYEYPEEKEFDDLGKLYDNVNYEKNRLKQIDAEKVIIPMKRIEIIDLNESEIKDNTLSNIYIPQNEDILKNDYLNLDNINEIDSNKKEKEGLNNERLR